VTAPGIGRIPIEIKPLYKKRYSVGQLKAFIEDQLVGRYMKPPGVEYGVFLMVPLVKRTWKVGVRSVDFRGLTDLLRSHAKEVGLKRNRTVEVATIDVASARKKAHATQE
jgi:hypothetical protein